MVSLKKQTSTRKKGDASDRLGPDEWIDAAYEAFQSGGMKAVRVEPLSKALGVTRGSFYWHFRDRDALIRAIMQRWSEEQTERVIHDNEAQGGHAAARLQRLLKTCGADDGRLEMGMRDWAADDAAAREEMHRVDERRIAYISELTIEAGLSPDEALARSRIAYIAWLGSYVGVITSSKESRLADMDVLFRMMLATESPA